MDVGSHITTVSHVEAWVISETEWCDVAKLRLAAFTTNCHLANYIYIQKYLDSDTFCFCYFAFHTFTMDLIEVQTFSFNSRARVNL